jgi:hypothetical protein
LPVTPWILTLRRKSPLTGAHGAPELFSLMLSKAENGVP